MPTHHPSPHPLEAFSGNRRRQLSPSSTADAATKLGQDHFGIRAKWARTTLESEQSGAGPLWNQSKVGQDHFEIYAPTSLHTCSKDLLRCATNGLNMNPIHVETLSGKLRKTSREAPKLTFGVRGLVLVFLSTLVGTVGSLEKPCSPFASVQRESLSQLTKFAWLLAKVPQPTSMDRNASLPSVATERGVTTYGNFP